MLRACSLVVLCGCYSHARVEPRCATPIAFDVAYGLASAADVVISAIRADHADYEAEVDDQDEIDAATAALAAAPAALDREMIANALDLAKPGLARCARPDAQPIRISIAVIPAGTVGRVVVRDHVDATTSACVVDILQTTLFPMTRRGGSFTYPFML